MRGLLQETEIRQNDVSIRTDEHVLWFEVLVDDSVLVETFDTLDNLGGVEAGLSQPSPPQRASWVAKSPPGWKSITRKRCSWS